MAAADDRRLLELSAEPRGALFIVLERPNAFWPLLVLLALLPGLYALRYRAMDTGGALWGLRSLNVYEARDVEDVLDLGGVTEERVLRWRSPLGAWVTALVMWIWTPAEPLALVLVSYFATAGIVAMGYVFGDWIAGPRCGFWTTLLLAFHSTLLVQAQTPAPYSLTVLLAMLAFWGYVRHIESTSSVVSTPLVLGALALGLCLLSSGPVAAAVSAVLLLYALSLRGEKVRPRRSPTREPKRVWVGWRALRSLAVFGAMALVVGGWWPGFMSIQYGMRFWRGWLVAGTDGLAPDTDALDATNPQRLLDRVLDLLGPAVGLALLGAGLAAREAFRTSAEAERRRHTFLLAWLTVAAAIWFGLLFERETPTLQLWEGLLLVPCALAAGFAAEAVAQRRVSTAIAIATACLTVLAFLATSIVDAFQRLDRPTATWLAVLSVLAVALASAWLFRQRGGRDFQKRLILGALLVALLAGNAVWGLAAVRRTGVGERAMDDFRAELRLIENVSSWLIVGERPVSLQLRLVLRSLWPGADRKIVQTWDAALADVLTHPPARDARVIVVDCSTRGIRPTRIQIEELDVTAVTDPRSFENKQLAAYELRTSRSFRQE